MKIAVLALTRGGELTAARIQRAYLEGEVDLYLPEKLMPKIGEAGLQKGRTYFKDSFQEVFEFVFHQYRALVCVMAVGIVVRIAAPFLNNKYHDPAVVVLDEKGKYAVSLLSGHLGGANELALEIAEKIGAQAVITTATDVCGKPAVEMLAREYKLALEPRENIKKLNWALAHDIPIKVFVQEGIELPPVFSPGQGHFEGPYKIREPQDVQINAKGCDDSLNQPCLVISTNLYPNNVFESINCVLGRPQYIVLGVGCKRGISPEQLIQFVHHCFQEEGLSPLCLKKIVSIELKNNEEGLREAARRLEVPLEFVTEDQIKNLKADVSRSIFVEEITGVGCVCEPAALIGAGREELLWKKKKYQGMTTAAAGETYRWWE